MNHQNTITRERPIHSLEPAADFLTGESIPEQMTLPGQGLGLDLHPTALAIWTVTMALYPSGHGVAVGETVSKQ